MFMVKTGFTDIQFHPVILTKMEQKRVVKIANAMHIFLIGLFSGQGLTLAGEY